jgi:hypothetical protein
MPAITMRSLGTGRPPAPMAFAPMTVGNATAAAPALLKNCRLLIPELVIPTPFERAAAERPADPNPVPGYYIVPVRSATTFGTPLDH